MNPPSRLPPGQHLAAPHKWPLVGEKTPDFMPEIWTVKVTGCVENPTIWTAQQLTDFPTIERTIDIHCVTRWSKLGMTFRGVLLQDVLQQASPQAEAHFVSFSAHSGRQHSTSLHLADALELGVLLAFSCNGQPLSVEHGGPVRIVTPGRYFYKSLKWLARIELLAEDRLGYWEAEAGYHNQADPWQEQRFLASNLNKQEMARLISLRDFSGLELRSIACAHRDLSGLRAAHALLRNADFRRCLLPDSDFQQANLSNAHFQQADLRRANLSQADLEGADFHQADLRGADLRGSSLFGATFCNSNEGALLDLTTQIDPSALADLAPEQADFLKKHLFPHLP